MKHDVVFLLEPFRDIAGRLRSGDGLRSLGARRIRVRKIVHAEDQDRHAAPLRFL